MFSDFFRIRTGLDCGDVFYHQVVINLGQDKLFEGSRILLMELDRDTKFFEVGLGFGMKMILAVFHRVGKCLSQRKALTVSVSCRILVEENIFRSLGYSLIMEIFEFYDFVLVLVLGGGDLVF